MFYYSNIYTEPTLKKITFAADCKYQNFIGNYPEFYHMSHIIINNYLERGEYSKAAGHLRIIANQAYMNSHKDEALKFYREYITASDSAQMHATIEQLNKLTKEFRLKELEQENKIVLLASQKAKLVSLIIAIICLLLVVILYSYIRYNRKLREHNHNLYLNIRQQNLAESKISEFRIAVPEQKLTKEEILFRQINEELWNKKLFTNESFGRDDLAAHLGTNRTYLGDAIKSCTDDQLSIAKYINLQRLKYACMLLEKPGDLSIDNIAIYSGFASRTTFFRLFKA